MLAIVSARLPADAEAVAAALPTLPVDVARAVLRLLAQKAPDHADQASLGLLGHEDPGLQLEALRALAASSQSMPAAPLAALLGSPAGGDPHRGRRRPRAPR